MIIGITGNSGTGKSEIAKMLAQKIKAEIVNADEIARKMTETNTEYLKKILEIFGNEILTENTLNRQKLAEIIYHNSEKKEQLNCLTYKYVVDEIKSKINKLNKADIIIDAPLLFESGLNQICDFNISILADKDTKINRICKRDNVSKDKAQARLNIQNDDKYYIEKSDYIIENNKKLKEIDLEEICIKIGKN